MNIKIYHYIKTNISDVKKYRGFGIHFYSNEIKDFINELNMVSNEYTLQFFYINEFVCFIYTTPLKNEVDEFGRKGIYISHGFLFPKEIWEKISFVELKNFTLKQSIKSFDDIKTSNYIDFENGKTKPYILDIDKLENIEDLKFDLSSNNEKIYKAFLVALISNKDLFIKIDSENSIDDILKIINFLPKKLKSKIKFYDKSDKSFLIGENNIALYYIDSPSSNNTHIDINFNEDVYHNYNLEKNLFFNWFNHQNSDITNKEIDTIFELSYRIIQLFSGNYINEDKELLKGLNENLINSFYNANSFYLKNYLKKVALELNINKSIIDNFDSIVNLENKYKLLDSLINNRVNDYLLKLSKKALLNKIDIAINNLDFTKKIEFINGLWDLLDKQVEKVSKKSWLKNIF